MGIILLNSHYSPLEAAIILGIRDIKKIKSDIGRWLLGEPDKKGDVTGREIARYIMDAYSNGHAINPKKHPAELLNGNKGEISLYWQNANDAEAEQIDIPSLILPMKRKDVRPQEYKRLTNLTEKYWAMSRQSMQIKLSRHAVESNLKLHLDAIVYDGRMDHANGVETVIVNESSNAIRYPVVRFYLGNGVIHYHESDVDNLVQSNRIFDEDFPYDDLEDNEGKTSDKRQVSGKVPAANHEYFLSAKDIATQLDINPRVVSKYFRKYPRSFQMPTWIPDSTFSIRKLYNACPENIRRLQEMIQDGRKAKYKWSGSKKPGRTS